jgi:hypothetical protein
VKTEIVAELSGGWSVTFDPNHVPLNFWHAFVADKPQAAPSFSGPAFDLMQRQADPLPPGDGPVRYNCRFMLTGEIPDARLVMEDSTIAGDWKLYVNGVQISGWERAIVFDCRNIEAAIGHALRGGSTPTLNVVTIETTGPGRGLKEVPYLYGSFTCEYRYGHLSFPFLEGPAKARILDVLEPWNVLGYPTFSGSAAYWRTLSVVEPGDFVLDLGRVEDIASVALDGPPSRLPDGVLAWPPYRCCLGTIAAGTHELAIEVTNAPGNRNRAAGLPAGLLGPIRLLRRR